MFPEKQQVMKRQSRCEKERERERVYCMLPTAYCLLLEMLATVC